jgi:hypothetical protein
MVLDIYAGLIVFWRPINPGLELITNNVTTFLIDVLLSNKQKEPEEKGREGRPMT